MSTPEKSDSTCRIPDYFYLGGLIGALFFLLSCSTTVHDHYGFSNKAELQKIQPWDSSKGVSNKKSYEELLELGGSYLASNNLQIARLHFLLALKKRPASALAHIGLGKIFLREGHFEKAHCAFSRALTLEPANKEALLNLGLILDRQGDFSGAMEYLDQALAINIEDPLVLGEMALIYEQMGKLTVAQEYHEQVKLLRPDQPSSYNNLGFNYLLQKKCNEAESRFHKALELAPNSTLIRNNLATALVCLNQENKALELFKSTVGEAGAYNNIGYIYMNLGEKEKAARAFEQALKVRPETYLRAQDNLIYLQQQQRISDN